MTAEGTRERAIELRRAGATHKQIAVELNVSMGLLCRWIKDAGLVGAGRTAQMDRDRAVELRRMGQSYSEIERETGVAKSTLSYRLKDIPLTPEHAALLAQKRLQGAVLLYWAEGSKSKPWSRGHRVKLSNSDPGMVRFFLRWLTVLGVGVDQLVLRVQIHERADIDAAHRIWSQVTGVPVELFRRPTLKRHNPKTTRRNVGAGYIGCLSVEVTGSTELYLRIAGWYEGITAKLTESLAP
ncbi:MAG TPA: hypothetical protein VM841_01745 [Actinomycetota bacterium]|nr:hypothetical protein [Actinomycetota bacterium]